MNTKQKIIDLRNSTHESIAFTAESKVKVWDMLDAVYTNASDFKWPLIDVLAEELT